MLKIADEAVKSVPEDPSSQPPKQHVNGVKLTFKSCENQHLKFSLCLMTFLLFVNLFG